MFVINFLRSSGGVLPLIHISVIGYHFLPYTTQVLIVKSLKILVHMFEPVLDGMDFSLSHGVFFKIFPLGAHSKQSANKELVMWLLHVWSVCHRPGFLTYCVRKRAFRYCKIL